MGEKEDKEKAEKLAAAKKRVAQLQKAKKKAGEATTESGKPSKQRSKDEESKPPNKNASSGTGQGDLASRREEKTEQEEETVDQGERTASDATTAVHPSLLASETGQLSEATISEGHRQDGAPEVSTVLLKTGGELHGRQPSLSIQSKMRSDSFRRTSAAAPLSPSATAGALPPLSPDGETMNDIYRKQAIRLEELERENKRLEKEARDGESQKKRSEEELEKLREVYGEASALKEQAKQAEQAQTEISQLNAEVVALQRQLHQRGHSHSVSKTTKSHNITSVGDFTGSPDSLRRELESRDSTIVDMELEISRLRSELSTKNSSCETRGSQISALQESLSSTQRKLRNLEGEFADSRKALTRASEKAVKEGVEKTSSNTKMKNLERDLAEASRVRDEIMKRAENLEKKIETMNKLHREAEARNAAKLSAAEAQGREASLLKARLSACENENSKLREEKDRRKNREAGGLDDEGLEELEDEERVRLERRVRELEGEVFDLKRGVWREQRREMQPLPTSDQESMPRKDDAGDFDEVDLSASGPASRRASLVQPAHQKHSTLSTVINSGLAAFRGSPDQIGRPRQDSFLPELEDDSAFDEEAFATAQREEEARKMVEYVREVKRKLRDWEGWRLDLVDARRSAAGMLGGGLGEMFEV